MLRQRLNNQDAERRAEEIYQTLAGSGPVEAMIKVLSDLTSAVSHQLERRWTRLPVDRRRILAREMATAPADDLNSDFERALAIGLRDSDREVRSWAARGLRDHELDATARVLMEALAGEEVAAIRAEIVESLDIAAQRFAFGKPEDELSEDLLSRLLSTASDDPSRQVRQTALATLGYFGADESCDEMIAKAFESDQEDEMAAAVKAMGRSGVSRWRARIERAILSSDEDLRAEAVRAIGCSGDQRFAATLVQLAYEDDEVRGDAIDALGEVGGQTAIRALRDLSSSQDEGVGPRAEAALDAATLLESVGPPRRP